MNERKFTTSLISTVEAKFGEILAAKPEGHKHLNYVDGAALTAAVRNVFTNRIGMVPPAVDAACNLSLAVVAPSFQQKEQLIKTVVGISGGLSGMAMILSGIGAALGWGAGLVATITAFFVGTSMAGPVAWVVSGVGVAAICGYFAFTGDAAKNTERYLNCLKNSLGEAMPSVWLKHGDELSAA